LDRVGIQALGNKWHRVCQIQTSGAVTFGSEVCIGLYNYELACWEYSYLDLERDIPHCNHSRVGVHNALHTISCYFRFRLLYEHQPDPRPTFGLTHQRQRSLQLIKRSSTPPRQTRPRPHRPRIQVHLSITYLHRKRPAVHLDRADNTWNS
jgi:hypothetical protein